MGEHVEPAVGVTLHEDGTISYEMCVPAGTEEIYRPAFERACRDVDAMITKSLVERWAERTRTW